MPRTKCLPDCQCGNHTRSGNKHPTQVFQPGQVAWNKGLKGVSEETSAKMSASAKKISRTGQGLGRHHSEGTKAKLSASALGRPVTWGNKISEGKKGIPRTPEHNSHAKEARERSTWKPPRGSSHWNFKGGVINYLKSDSSVLKEWRKAVFERDDWTCQGCEVRGGVELNADHIVPKWADLSLAFTISNGRTLCRPCHVETKTFGWKAPRRPSEFQLPLPMVVQ